MALVGKAQFERLVEALRDRVAVMRDRARYARQGTREAKPAAPPAAAAFGGIFDRLLGRGAARAMDASAAASQTLAETRALFPEAEHRSDPARDLLKFLMDSARQGAGRSAHLKDAAKKIRKELRDRNEYGAFSLGQSLRAIVAMIWVGIAVWLVLQVAGPQFDLSVPVVIPPADAKLLAKAFGTLGLIGFFAAAVPYYLVLVQGRLDNGRIVRASEHFGNQIARMVTEFDRRLGVYRDVLGNEKDNNDQVLAAVSEAHVTAQEAATLFHEVGFLFDQQDAGHAAPIDQGIEEYDRFLAESGAVSEKALGATYREGFFRGFFAGAIIGFFFGFIAVLSALAGSLDLALQKLGMPSLGILEAYPWAGNFVAFGIAFFLLAGSIAETLVDMAGAGERRKWLGDSLRAVRSCLTAGQAPRASDIAQRVEDLSEIFRVRLGKARAAPAKSAAGSAALASEETPAWRKPAEAPRFVGTSFQATPKPWLADPPAEARASRKNIFSLPGTGPKRGG
jgi:hypothetical protein